MKLAPPTVKPTQSPPPGTAISAETSLAINEPFSGWYCSKELPSNRNKPSVVPNHKYPSVVWTTAVTFPLTPCLAFQEVWWSCERGWLGSSAKVEEQYSVNVRQIHNVGENFRENNVRETRTQKHTAERKEATMGIGLPGSIANCLDPIVSPQALPDKASRLLR
jgi:hypothetical protein